MSRKYKFNDNDKLYFISYAVVEWIDLFIRKEYKDLLIESWKYCQKEKDLEIYGWCIMSSHIHMIIGSHGRELSKIVSEMKSYSSRMLRKSILSHPKESRRRWILDIMKKAGQANSNNKDWQLWQQHNKPITLFSSKLFYQKLDYIHKNPVKAGFVERMEDYTYSSAIDFYGGRGLIELSYFD